MSSSFTPILPIRPAIKIGKPVELDELDDLLSEEVENLETETSPHQYEMVQSPPFNNAASAEDSEFEDEPLEDGEYLDDDVEDEEIYSALPASDRRGLTKLRPILGNPQDKIAKINAQSGQAKPRKTRKDAGVPRGSKGSGTRQCALCKQSGHNRKTCPKNIPAMEAQDKKALELEARRLSGKTIKCSICAEQGHNSRTCPMKDDPDYVPAVKYTKTRSSTTTCSLCGEQGHNKATCRKNSDNSDHLRHIIEAGGVIEL